MAVHQDRLLPAARLLYEVVRGLEVGGYVDLLLVAYGTPQTPGTKISIRINNKILDIFQNRVERALNATIWFCCGGVAPSMSPEGTDVMSTDVGARAESICYGNKS